MASKTHPNCQDTSWQQPVKQWLINSIIQIPHDTWALLQIMGLYFSLVSVLFYWLCFILISYNKLLHPRCHITLLPHYDSHLSTTALSSIPKVLLWRDLTVIDSGSYLLYILMKNKLKKIYFKSNLKSTFNRTFLKFQQQTNQRAIAEPHKTINYKLKLTITKDKKSVYGWGRQYLLYWLFLKQKYMLLYSIGCGVLLY